MGDTNCQIINVKPGNRIFQIAIRGYGGESPQWREGKFCKGFEGWWESDKKWIWPFKTFSKLKKKISVNIEHWLKSKLEWPMCSNSMKLKMVQEQQLQLKWIFYWVITWKLLLSGGNEPLVGWILQGGNFS